MLALQAGDAGAARAAFEATLGVDPRHALALYRLAELDLAAGAQAAAAERLRSLLASHPDHAAGRALLARLEP